MLKTNVVVIGAGAVGCAIARELSKYQIDVIVVDKNEDVGGDASKSNSAIIHTGYDATPDSLESMLVVAANPMYENLVKDLDVPFSKIGAILPAITDEQFSQLPQIKAKATKNRVYDVEFKTKEEALAAYSKYLPDADAEYARVIDFDVTNLEPVATVGYKPDQVKTIAELEGTKINQIYIGSCTNGRIEDLRIAASILKGKKISPDVRAIVSPATPKIYRQALSEGIIEIFMDAGFCVTNPTCGACLGMSNGVLASGESCASTTNRNFNGRMGKGGMVHLMSPASAAAAAIAGCITNSPLFKK